MAITLVLILHTLVAAALVAVILLQRSEGGGLGIGGGTGGGLVSARGAADLMTRTTSILAGAFVLTSIVLAVLYGRAGRTRQIDAAAAGRALPTAPLAAPIAPPPTAPQPGGAPFAGFGAPAPGGADTGAQPGPTDAASPVAPAPVAPLAR